MWAFENPIYQIYPLGFTGAPHENDGILSHRILKTEEWVDHLEKLQIGAVLFNPVFESDRHGYDTRDYRKIDVRLGTNEDFAKVCKTLHAHGMKVILDGVFNHVGRGFFAFRDVLEKKWDSPYKDWFKISFDGNSNYNDGFWYEGWEGHFELVKLNLSNPDVRQYLFESVKYWIDTFGIDGLRLDVAYCIDRDFLHALHEACVSFKPDFFLVGEALFGDYNPLLADGMLDAVTNYECYKGIYSSINSRNFFEVSYSYNRQFGSEPWCLYRGKHLLSFADNHDVSRIASLLGDRRNLPVAYGLIYAMPGIPCVYYGSEWGIEGRKEDGDDALRPCPEKPEWNALTDLIAKLGCIFRKEKALQYGSYRNVQVTNPQLVFERNFEKESIYALFNLDDAPFAASCGELNGTFTDLVKEESVTLTGAAEIPAHGFLLLKRK